MAKEFEHARWLKARKKRVFADVDAQKHFISYKNDWVYRDPSLDSHSFPPM